MSIIQALFVGNDSEIVAYITTTSVNVDASSYFTSQQWLSRRKKRLVVNPGVVVGASSISTYALTVPSGFNGGLTLENNGSIQGAGGAANGGTGGNALFAGAQVSINNFGSICAGGGGGGYGGNGGTGGQGSFTTTTTIGGAAGNQALGCNGVCRSRYSNPDAYCISPNPDGVNCVGSFQAVQIICRTCLLTVTTYTNGGVGGGGGSGGKGRGFEGGNAPGSGGAPGTAGDTNAGNGGTGGTGGTGGDWGAYGNGGATGETGANGNYTAGEPGTGGGGGGAPGYYIINNYNVIWLANGTRLGLVG